MWILFAFGSALFAGLTAILAKCGIRNTDSNVATALRTGVVLVFSWLMVFMVGAQSEKDQKTGFSGANESLREKNHPLCTAGK